MRLWKAMFVVTAMASTPAAAVRAADAGDGPGAVVVGGAPAPKPASEKPSHYIEIPISGPRAELQSDIASHPLNAEQDAQLTPLIRQLADSDFRKREEAVDQLKAMGPATLLPLKQARDAAKDPEVANRADSVIRYFEHPTPPATPSSFDPYQARGRFGGRGGGGGFVGRMDGNVNLRVTLENGTKSVDVRENNGRTIRISDGPDGIDMQIATGDAVREVHARTPEQLKKQDEEAFNLYQKWMGRGGPGGVIHWRGRGQMPLPPAIPAPQRFRPAVPQQVNPFNNNQPGRVPGADDPQQQQREMLRMLDELRRAQGGGDPGAAAGGAVVNPVDPAQQAADFLQRIERDQREMRRQAEALQQHVAEAERRAMNANGAAPAIPPRSARLGVRIVEDPQAGMVTVTEILPGERAEKLGLKPMDAIRSINGNKVSDGDSLRQALASAKPPLVVEILRNAESMKLAEK